MPSITLTPLVGIAAVIVNVITDGKTLTTLYRYDANGSPSTVRMPSGVLPTSNPPVIIDYEPAVGASDLTYVARFSDGTSVSRNGSGLLAAASSWVSVPIWPEKAAQVQLVTGYDASRATGTRYHEIIDRPDPAVTLAPLRTRAGMLEIWCSDYAAAAAVVDVHALAQVLMFRQPDHPGLDMYYAVDGSVTAAPYQTSPPPIRWVVRVPYREVSRPAGDVVANIGWTFDAVTTEFATFADLPPEFATFDALATQERT